MCIDTMVLVLVATPNPLPCVRYISINVPFNSYLCDFNTMLGSRQTSSRAANRGGHFSCCALPIGQKKNRCLESNIKHELTFLFVFDLVKHLNYVDIYLG